MEGGNRAPQVEGPLPVLESHCANPDDAAVDVSCRGRGTHVGEELGAKPLAQCHEPRATSCDVAIIATLFPSRRRS